jgi:DNA-binding Xre family transcriptional regulator
VKRPGKAATAGLHHFIATGWAGVGWDGKIVDRRQSPSAVPILPVLGKLQIESELLRQEVSLGKRTIRVLKSARRRAVDAARRRALQDVCDVLNHKPMP